MKTLKSAIKLSFTTETYTQAPFLIQIFHVPVAGNWPMQITLRESCASDENHPKTHPATEQFVTGFNIPSTAQGHLRMSN